MTAWGVTFLSPKAGNGEGSGARPTHRCPACGVEKPTSEFAPDASKSLGHKSHCRKCDAARSARWYAANRERKLAYMRSRTKTNDARDAGDARPGTGDS